MVLKESGKVRRGEVRERAVAGNREEKRRPG